MCNVITLKRFFNFYTSNFRGASALRNDLMQTNKLDDVKTVVKAFKSNNNST